MSILNVVKVPDNILKQKSSKIEKITDEIKTLVDDMIETMYETHGIGLAAVQVGKLLRIVVIDVDHDYEERDGQKYRIKENPIVLINPEITKYSEEKKMMEEGCLSVPKQRESVLRSLEVEVKYQDLDMNEKTIKADGLLAHCLQHEIDHTNGIVYIDYLSKIKRDNIIKKVQKLEKFNN